MADALKRRARLTWRHVLLAPAFLTCLVVGVFWPVVEFEFIDYDVPGQVINNPYIRGMTADNLVGIFTTRGNGGSTDSYYPVRTLTYAMDWQLWGLEAGGFKLTNGFIHLLNTLLVFWLVIRLFGHWAATAGTSWWDMLVATFSAAIFAVHPVVVESVVWLAAREELLMTLGALGCLHLHITARRMDERGDGRTKAILCHASAALCCLAACLSNAVAAVIPVLILVWDLLTLRPLALRRILYGTTLLWVISLVTVVLKVQGNDGDPALERAANLAAVIGQLGYANEGAAVSDAMKQIEKISIPVNNEVGLFSVERLAVVLNVYWLNVKTLLWPTRLAVVYSPVAPGGAADAEVVLGGMVVGLTCAALWMLRRRKLIVFGLLWFVVALVPASQIMPHHIHRADRFLYLPLAGLVLVMAIGLRPLHSALQGRVAVLTIAFAGIVALMGVVSYGQVQTWWNSLSMWDRCVTVSPDSFMAQRGLADNLALHGRVNEAVEHYRIAVRLNPRLLEMMSTFALALANGDSSELGDYELAVRMAKQICQLTERSDRKYLHTLAVTHGRLAACLAERGDFNSAAEHYADAVEAAEEAQDTALASQFLPLLSACRNGTSNRNGPRVAEPSEHPR